MQTITLLEVEKMVKIAIRDNNIRDVINFYVKFMKWSDIEIPKIDICLYCRTPNGNPKNISVEHKDPIEVIRLLIYKYKQYDVVLNPVELAI